MSEYGKKVEDETKKYMNNLNSVDKEVSDIQHAVEGVQVRGALAAGVRKSFDKSKVAETKSEEAINVTNNILDESFDSSAINANFEQRLDDEINNLQPDWTQFKDQTNSQLEETENKNKALYHGYYPGAVFTFNFDDAPLADWTRFKPIFESEGVPGCAAVITSQVGKSDHGYESMTWEQLKELKRLGWTVGSHTHTHTRPSDMSTEEIDFELRESSRLLQKHGLDHDIIIYPFGDVSNGLLEMARKYYKMGINIVRYNLSNDIPEIDNLNLVRIPGLSQQLDDGTYPTLEYCKNKVDEAISNGSLAMFEDHSGVSTYNDEAKLLELRELIQYIKSKGAPIVNNQDAFNMKCNVIDITKDSSFYKLHRDGTISQRDLSFNTHTVSGNSALDTIPRHFEVGKITVDRFSGLSTHAEEAYRTTGVRFTHKIVDAPNTMFQEVYNRNGYFIRFTDGTYDRWLPFENFSNTFELKEKSGLSFDKLPSAFEEGKVTYDRLNRDASHVEEAYHEPSIRSTSKLTEAKNTLFQEVINPNGKYIRFADISNDSWGAFEKIEIGNEVKYERFDSSAFSINKNSTIDVDMPVPGLHFTDVVTVSSYAFFTVPDGIMHNVLRTTDNKIVVRFANITDSPINVPSGSWAISYKHR